MMRDDEQRKLSAAVDLLRIDANDPDDVFHDPYAYAARILSLLASGEWALVPSRFTTGQVNQLHCALGHPDLIDLRKRLSLRDLRRLIGVFETAAIAAAPDPLENGNQQEEPQ